MDKRNFKNRSGWGFFLLKRNVYDVYTYKFQLFQQQKKIIKSIYDTPITFKDYKYFSKDS